MIDLEVNNRGSYRGLLVWVAFKREVQDLSSAWRRVDGPMPPKADDSAWVHTIPKVMNLLTALGLAAKPPEETPVKVPGKRGRPKGSKNKKTLEREARERAQAAADSQAP